MGAGDAGGVEPYVRARVAPDRVLTLAQGKAPARYHEPVADAGGVASRRLDLECLSTWSLLELWTECVADAMRGPDDGRTWIPIAELPADLLDESHQRGIADERPGSQTLMQLRFWDNARCLVDQEHEQIECFRREVHGRVMAAHLAPRDVDCARAES